jgi:hypothetical protein
LRAPVPSDIFHLFSEYYWLSDHRRAAFIDG